MMEERSTSVPKVRLKHLQRSSARSAEWMIHLGLLWMYKKMAAIRDGGGSSV